MAALFRRTRPKMFATVLALVLVSHAAPLSAQIASADASSNAQAEKTYAVKCALCHGAAAHGGEYGPALAGNNDLRGNSTAWLHDVIQNGIPSGGMPAFNLPPSDIDALASWIESMNIPAAQSSGPGDRAAGEQYFFGVGKCASCHMVAGRGSVSGPDLSSIASTRTAPEIRAALLHPSANATPGYESVTVTLRNGAAIRGFARSQSNFEITLQDSDGKFHRILQSQILSVSTDTLSPMPPAHADPAEMENLMAYLSGLTGVEPGTNAIASPSTKCGVSLEDILHPSPDDWLTYNGDLSGNRYCRLTQINTANVKQLQLQWISAVPLWKQFYPDTSYLRETSSSSVWKRRRWLSTESCTRLDHNRRMRSTPAPGNKSGGTRAAALWALSAMQGLRRIAASPFLVTKSSW